MLVQVSPISSWKCPPFLTHIHTHTHTHTCILQVFSLACLFTSPTLKHSLRTPSRLLLLCLPGPYSPSKPLPLVPCSLSSWEVVKYRASSYRGTDGPRSEVELSLGSRESHGWALPQGVMPPKLFYEVLSFPYLCSHVSLYPWVLRFMLLTKQW